MSYKRTNRGAKNSSAGYAAFRSSVATMDAAALQSDIASRYSLPGSQMTIKVCQTDNIINNLGVISPSAKTQSSSSSFPQW
jgi:hypothetical protein